MKVTTDSTIKILGKEYVPVTVWVQKAQNMTHYVYQVKDVCLILSQEGNSRYVSIIAKIKGSLHEFTSTKNLSRSNGWHIVFVVDMEKELPGELNDLFVNELKQ